jgi:hypothetical protein
MGDELMAYDPRQAANIGFMMPGMDPLYAPQFQPGSLGGFMPRYDEDGAVDPLNTNTFQDFMQIMSDPAFLVGMLGDQPGGLGGFGSPAFQPSETIESVDAPGYQSLQYYGSRSDPISRIIAEEIASGGTALSAEIALKGILANPNDPLYPEVAPYMQQLTYTDQSTGEPMPDWKRVQDIATSIEKGLISDPTGFEVDENGNPIRRTAKDSPAAEYAREMGLPDPAARYGVEATRDQQGYQKYLDNQSARQEQQGRPDRTKAELEAAMKYLAEFQPLVGQRQMPGQQQAYPAAPPVDPMDRGDRRRERCVAPGNSARPPRKMLPPNRA